VSHEFHIVDVFAERKYAGNQLAVVLDAGDVDGDTMQQIARETNFSETTFVLGGERDGRVPVRIFTPAAEVPFAGHPTLGTAWVVHRHRLEGPREALTLGLAAGDVRVSFERAPDASELLWMHQRPPELGPTAPAADAARVVGLEPGDLDTGRPVQQVSTGLGAWILAVRGLAAVRRCRVDLDAYARFVARGTAQSILVWTDETSDPTVRVHARMFAPGHGVLEDPATGSANGCLAAYLVEHEVFGSPEIDLRVEQGIEMGRPSLLRLRAWKRDGRTDVFVGGRVIPVAEGRLL